MENTNNTYDTSSRSSYQPPLYQQHVNRLMMSAVGLPVTPNGLSAMQQQQQISCSQPQQQQQQQQQPIFNQIYQSLHSYPQLPSHNHNHNHHHHHHLHQQTGPFQPTSATTFFATDTQQQHLFVNTMVARHPAAELSCRNPSGQLPSSQQQSIYATTIPSIQPQMEKSSSITQFTQMAANVVGTPNPQLPSSSLSSSSSLPPQPLATDWQHRRLTNNELVPANAQNNKTTADNQRQKLVDSSCTSTATSSITSSSTHSPRPQSQTDTKTAVVVPASSAGNNDKKLKSYLTHLVLASNIPFAYAIILVAFLITIIASTSIITILTIVLTITGYTAYPTTESTFNTSLTIGVLCASIALALVTALLIFWRRHCQAAYYYLDDPQTGSRGSNSPQLSETYDDTEYGSVQVADWAKHVQKLHVDGDIGFSKEFEQIQQATNQNLSYSHSQLPENKHKNRYINIVAYDHTRVTLRPLPGQKKPGFDYINANFIDGYNKPRAYIGTQGPLVSTFDDYWRMIWEQRVVIIVMITNLQERGRRKCDMYWPKEGTETYGYVQVKLLQEVVMATYTLRTFTAKNLKMKKRSGSERTVYQYHYTNWPDHGVPDHPLPVLSFVRKSASANPPGAGAIICHCSAGCGRSGTYIVIDAMLKQIAHRQSINVVDFLKHIRSQRNYLVQTEEQYIFIHDALVEAIESGETEIASNFIAKYIQLLQTGGQQQAIAVQASSTTKNNYSLNSNGIHSPIDTRLGGPGQLSVAGIDNQSSVGHLVNSQSNLLLSQGNSVTIHSNNSKNSLNNITSRSQSAAGNGGGGQWSLLERQYRLVASFKAKDFNVVSALKPCNKNKNRTLNLIPLEAHRVHITPKPGADGSDYINATFLMGFNHLREFIVTQHPVYETFSDFWQMVYDHNSQTIVLLTQMNDLTKEYPQFWPQKEDEVDYGSFKVKLIQESTLVKPENGGLIITRDFIMRSNQDDYELQTRVIHCPGWPECCGPLSGVFDLIQVVQNATQQQASQQRMHDGQSATITVTIGQEHEPQNGGPIIVVDKFGGTEAATFAVLTTLFKQINFEDAVDVYMYAKLAHLRRPGIWSSQDDYLFLYRAIENYASSMNESAAANPNPANNNFHHQTMTLDRHRHKSANASLKTSTMRRGQTASQQQTFSSELSKSNSHLLVDHNHNHLIKSSPLIQPMLVNNATLRRNNKNSMLVEPVHQSNHNNHLMTNQGSPYNSAVSIGTSPHQHLLAGSNNGPRQASQQQQQTTQSTVVNPQPMDHYLYPMS